MKKAIICTVSELATDYRLHKLAGTIAKSGFEVSFICRKKRNSIPFTNHNYQVTYLNTIWQKGPLFYLLYNISIFFYLLFHKANLIVSVDLDTIVGCGSAKTLKPTQLLFDSHEYFPEVPEIQNKWWIKKIWLLAEKWFVPKIDLGVTVCEPIADIYKTKYHKDFLVIRNAPLKDRIADSIVEPNTNDKFTLIYQGAVNHGRALRELIDAMNLIKDVKLIIVGDGDILTELKDRARKLSDRITFIGKVPFSELPRYTKQADLGIALLEDMGLNNYYALPNRLFDSLQAELPVLGIDFPEVKRFIHENDFGMVINDIRPQTIANAILTIKNNPNQLKQWRNNAAKAKRKVNWENETKNLINILKTLN